MLASLNLWITIAFAQLEESNVLCLVREELKATKSVNTRAAETMVNFLSLAREHWAIILVPMGFVVGCYLDRREDNKLTAFRNKSLLFRRELKPGEEVTWK
ncbi:hypothetical protein NQZ68_004962 [Dissostichus eleginoides]|nr:hypothetical protein NQZ68_004962 [Dissostichus eleginoides]